MSLNRGLSCEGETEFSVFEDLIYIHEKRNIIMDFALWIMDYECGIPFPYSTKG